MQLGSLLRRNKPLIGVDISSSAVKMLELAESGRDIRRVERYAIARLPKDALTDGSVAKPEVVEAAMREAWKAMQTKTREVALALPAAAVITKKILLPQGASELDIETQVMAEANQMAPFPLDEVSLDWQILGPAPRSPEENEALVASRGANGWRNGSRWPRRWGSRRSSSTSTASPPSTPMNSSPISCRTTPPTRPWPSSTSAPMPRM